MKRNLVFLIIVVLLIAAQAAASDWWYYHRDGSREILTPSNSFLTIKFSGQTPATQFLHSLQAATGLTDNSDPLDVGLGFWRFTIEPGADLQSLITTLLQYPEIRFVNPVIVQNNGKLLYAFDEILLRFKSGTSDSEQASLLQSLGLTVTIPSTTTTPFELVSMTATSERDVFAVSRSLFLSGLCRYASPNCGGYALDDLLGGTGSDFLTPGDWSYYRRDGSRIRAWHTPSYATVMSHTNGVKPQEGLTYGLNTKKLESSMIMNLSKINPNSERRNPM